MAPATVASADSTVKKNGSKIIQTKDDAAAADIEKADILPHVQISKLFSRNVVFKIWKTATEHLVREVCFSHRGKKFFRLT